MVDSEDASSVYLHESSSTPLDSSKVLQFRKSLSMVADSSLRNESMVDQYETRRHSTPLTSLDYLTGNFNTAVTNRTPSAIGSNQASNSGGASGI